MTDLITELRQKRQALVSEKTKLEQELKSKHNRLSDLAQAIEGIDSILRVEGFAIRREQLSLEDARKPADLVEVLTAILSDGNSHTLDDLAKRAQALGYDFGERNPLRSINATLLGASGGAGSPIRRLSGGQWALRD